MLKRNLTNILGGSHKGKDKSLPKRVTGNVFRSPGEDGSISEGVEHQTLVEQLTKQQLEEQFDIMLVHFPLDHSSL
jgi:hypothetical protein